MTRRIEPKEYLPDVAMYPGKSLEELLETRGISQVELAQRAGRPVQAINEIIKGKKEITAETALVFEKVLGIHASFWLQLERNYREALAREKELKNLESQLPLLKGYPYSEMISLGWVKDTRDRKERVAELLKWLGVGNLETIDLQYTIAFRKSNRFPLPKEKLAVWLRYGELQIQAIRFPRKFDPHVSSGLMRGLRRLTLLDASKGTDRIRELCKENGIALVFTPEFRRFPVSGVTRWIAGHPLIQVSLRYKTDDQLWFSIFHELGHVYRHNRTEMYIESFRDSLDDKDQEEQADAFARDHLIPSKSYQQFLKASLGKFNEHSIKHFAEQVEVAPGIVVGRLQHDGYLPMATYLHSLKRRLSWSKTE